MLSILQFSNVPSVDISPYLGTGRLVFIILFYLFLGFLWYKTFKNAGIRNAWTAFIPILNLFFLMKVIKKPMWWALLFFIPFIHLYASFVSAYRLAKGFGKENYAILLGILGVLTGLSLNMLIHAFQKNSFNSDSVLKK
ncbi:signal peptidase I [Elizabethkingia argentiflava]|uniref:Signal peptidase I n=1 Tax=Elizabethkingia argenteiflava TaxID=2681556 RepID=A0A845PVA1_9FLAO|nr:DUF5684 domain-containing protein [Elizabethkingia argenteiflava]NAW51754.1 signal peptidase I [Elizabethkingia argenteiflava]